VHVERKHISLLFGNSVVLVLYQHIRDGSRNFNKWGQVIS